MPVPSTPPSSMCSPSSPTFIDRAVSGARSARSPPRPLQATYSWIHVLPGPAPSGLRPGGGRREGTGGSNPPSAVRPSPPLPSASAAARAQHRRAKAEDRPHRSALGHIDPSGSPPPHPRRSTSTPPPPSSSPPPPAPRRVGEALPGDVDERERHRGLRPVEQAAAAVDLEPHLQERLTQVSLRAPGQAPLPPPPGAAHRRLLTVDAAGWSLARMGRCG